MNAISNLPLAAKVAIAFGLFIVLWSLSSSDEKATDASPQSVYVNQASDYGMTNFTLTIMDEFGKPSRVITGRDMAHYPDDDSTEITLPIAQFIENSQDTWIISSEHGKTHGKGENILLTDNVIITRKDNNEIELKTEKLNLDTQKNTAYTDSPVTIASPQGETHSVGLHATLEEKTINLHSKVKGQYDAPPIE